MMKKKTPQWWMMAALVCACVTMIVPIKALAAKDRPEGSLTVSLHEDKEGRYSWEGVEFALYQVMESEQETDAYAAADNWKKTADFADFSGDIADVLKKDAKAQEKLGKEAAVFIKEKAGQLSEEPLKGRTDAEGKVAFSGLEQGLYLVVATDINRYVEMNPFFVAIPYVMESDGELVHDVIAQPKADFLPEEIPSEPETTSGSPEQTEFAPIESPAENAGISVEEVAARTARAEESAESGSSIRTGDETHIAVVVFVFMIALMAVSGVGIHMAIGKKSAANAGDSGLKERAGSAEKK